MWRASFVVLVACSGPPPGGDGPGDDDDDTVAPTGTTGATGSTAETGGPPDTGTVTGPPGVRGVVVDSAGVPIDNCDVLACTVVTCFTDESAADGSFSFELDGPVHV